MRRFEGKAVLLTGAASGIARATALRLAEEGARVFGVDVDTAGLEETAKQVAAVGGEMRLARADVTRRQECFDAVAACVAELGRLDVLGNVAGVVRFAHFHEMTEADWDLVLGVNLSGTAFMCQASIPHLLESEGNIVNVASCASFLGQAYTVAYCASKGGVVQLTRALALEYLRKGIRVNAIAPGGVETPLSGDIQFPDGADGKLIQRYVSPRGLARPEEVAGIFAFLASDEARYVHGAVWSADAGLTAG